MDANISVLLIARHFTLGGWETLTRFDRDRAEVQDVMTR